MSHHGPSISLNKSTGMVQIPDRELVHCSIILDNPSDQHFEMLLNFIHRLGFGYSKEIGLFRYDGLAAGGYWEFGSDILSETYGMPQEEDDFDCKPSNQPPSLSYFEIFKSIGQTLPKTPGLMWQSFKKINWFGPHNVQQEDEEDDVGIHYNPHNH